MIARYKVLLFLNLAFCCVGAATKRFPAWRMFEKVETYELHLADKNGQPLFIYDYLPGDAYPTSLRLVKPVLSFICRREASRAPILVEEKTQGLRFSLGPGNCDVHAF